MTRVAWFDRTGEADRKVRTRRPRPPAQPKQGEIAGMETCDAATMLMDDKRRRNAKAEKITPEDQFDFDVRRFGLPKFERQWPFAREIGRKYKADFCSLEFRLIVEIEGLIVRRLPGGEIVLGGRHGTIGGFRDDCERQAIATELGWAYLRFEQSAVKSGAAIEHTQRVLVARGWKR